MQSAILLMGPTATGKTELALRLALHYPIEIISVDSALIYCDMNIGTAKPHLDELKQVPHHLINICSPLQTYSVAHFIRDSVELIHKINKQGRLPILVGGTMMYFNGLLNGISKLPEANAEIRADLHRRGTDLGWDKLHQELGKIDLVTANKVMPNDRQRIIRALEVYQLTGVPMSILQQENKVHLAKDINFLKLAIVPTSREVLHARINKRFLQMLDDGFVFEVEQLRQKYPTLTIDYPSMRSVGYYQAWQYLDGVVNYPEFVDMGTAATRQLAKRQITWLRSMDVINLDNSRENLNINQLFAGLLLYIKSFNI